MTQETTSKTGEPSLREQCIARHQNVIKCMNDFRYLEAIKELDDIIKMIKEA